MKNKKGFTLVEVIIVIALLALIAGIFAINMTGLLNKSKNDNNNSTNITIVSATKSYISSNPEKVKNLYKGYSHIDIKIGELRDEGYLSEDLKDTNTGELIPDGKIVRIMYNSSTGELNYSIFDENSPELDSYNLIAEPYFYKRSEIQQDNWCELNYKNGLGETLYFTYKSDTEKYTGNYDRFDLKKSSCNVNPNVLGNYEIKYSYIARTDENGNNIRETATRIVYVVPEEYNLSYDANSGNGELPENVKVIWSQEYTITSTIPTKAGYSFLGWSYDKTDKEPMFKTKQKVIYKPNDANQNQVLYAIWKPNEYTVKLDIQGGNYQGTAEIYETYDNKYSLTHDGEIMSSSKNSITLPKFPGYDFKGYWTGIEGSGEEYINENGYLTNAAKNNHFLGNGTLYAKWTPAKFWVSFNINLESIIDEAKEKLPISYTSEDQELLKDRQYTFNSPYGSLPVITKENYTFKGWFTEPTEGEEITTSTIFKQVEDGQVLYAHIEPITYTLTFSANGGSGGPDSVKAYIGDKITIPGGTPSRSCYSFSGWKNSSSTSTYYASNEFGPVNSDSTFTAQWSYNCYSYYYDDDDDDYDSSSSSGGSGRITVSLDWSSPNGGIDWSKADAYNEGCREADRLGYDHVEHDPETNTVTFW